MDWCVLSACFIQLMIVRAHDGPEVTLSTGKVQGLKIVSAANRVYYSFRGIPYAAPPVGPLRFRAPQPPKGWNGTLKAFDIPPACSQPWRKVKIPENYSEDCLYINVFTPYLKPPGDVLMPVMVWVHGGKMYQGSSTSFKYGADFLITQDVILVTLNYRLGVFGYLNLHTEGAQGNAAAKDKVAALRWVQKEIQQFGGDPSSVTIFGGSSGGYDVSLLYISPKVQGLFHRAIAHSPVRLSINPLRSFDPAVRLAEILGCSNYDAKVMVACLRDISAHVIAEKQMEVVVSRSGKKVNPFGVTLEEDLGEEVFMSSPPEDLVKILNTTVQYMVGMNSGEGKMYLDNPEDNPSQFVKFERDFEFYLPSIILEKNSKRVIDKIVKKLKSFYFGDKPISYENVYGFINFMTDRKYTFPIVQTAKAISAHASVYLYFFAFEGKFVASDKPTDILNLTGVNHGEELGYLFLRNTLISAQNHMLDYPHECKTLTRMVRLWTNFAKYGNPTPNESDGLLDVIWIPMNKTLTQHLIINDSLIMQEALFPERIALWESIYDSYVTGAQAEDKTISFVIIISVLCLSLISLVYLLYDCTCRDRDIELYNRI